jgi:GxxExxY protein
LKQQGIEVETEKRLPVAYKGVILDCGYRIDLLVEQTVIVESKAVQEPSAIHEAQILSYLKLSVCPEVF